MEEILLLHPTSRYKAGLAIKITGMKTFILSGRKMIPGGRTAGKVIAHMQFTEKIGHKTHSTKECGCCSAFFISAMFTAAASKSKVETIGIDAITGTLSEAAE